MKTLRKRSIQKQLMTVVVLSSIVPLLILSVFSVYFISSSAQDNMENRMVEILKSSEELLVTTINEQRLGVQTVGNAIIKVFKDDTLDNEAMKKQFSTLMYQFMLSSESTQNMYFIFPEGDYVGTSELPELYRLPTYEHWGIFRQASEQSGVTLYPNTQDSFDKFSNSYSLVYKVQTSNKVYGYLILDVSTEHVQKILNSVKGTSFGYIQFVVTMVGDRVIYNDSIFRSPISYLQNIFRYDRLSEDTTEEIQSKLDEVLMVSRTNEKEGITVYGMVPKGMLKDQATYLSIWLLVFITATGIIAMIIAQRSTHTVSKPIIDLVNKMQGHMPNENRSISNPDFNEIDELSYQFDQLMERIDTYHTVSLQKQELLRIAEIKSLMSQLNPHFLNNTLDSIKWKSKLYGANDIADMVTKLSVLLKVSMNTEPFVSVQEELEFIDSYVSIQKMRYGDKISYQTDISEDVLNLQIPKLILQPIVENSIVHGIEPLPKGGVITIESWIDAEFLYFKVKDNGAGSDFKLAESDDDTTSIGLKNVDSRLRLHYGKEYGLQWYSSVGEGTEVFIMIPING